MKEVTTKNRWQFTDDTLLASKSLPSSWEVLISSQDGWLSDTPHFVLLCLGRASGGPEPGLREPASVSLQCSGQTVFYSNPYPPGCESRPWRDGQVRSHAVSPADAQGWGVPPAFVKMPYWRSFVLSSEKFGIGMWRSYKISLRLNPISEQFFCLFGIFMKDFNHLHYKWIFSVFFSFWRLFRF